MKLNNQDLLWAVRRLPKQLVTIMYTEEWYNKIYVGGGYLRSIVSGEKVNDIDCFVGTKELARQLAYELANSKNDVIKTENSYTVKGPVAIQIIHRWLFDTPESVSNSFDFTVCCAVIYVNKDSKWDSFCDDLFYIDLAAKRLTYRSPIRNEDAGGSLLRVLKYYQKGYRIPLDSMGAVIARLMQAINPATNIKDEKHLGFVLSGLLREVDPSVDPDHIAHMPSSSEQLSEEQQNPSV